jgi:CRP-like cAMP-binding protein
MAIDEYAAALLRVPLLHGLKPLQITEIARRAARVVYHPGDIIMAENAKADGAVLLVTGEATCAGGSGLLGTGEAIPAGALLGEMAMLVETEHSTTVVAKTTVRALKILRSEIHAQMAEDPTLADHFVAVISRRLFNFAAGASSLEEKPPREERAPMPAPSANEQDGEARSSLYH